MTFPKNPLTMLGRLERCWLFTYQTPPEAVRELLPPPLEPVLFNGKAFWNVVVCRLRQMRPWPLPAPIGVGYWHVAYRLYARFQPDEGPPLEGVYFFRSDCDSRLMTLAGHLLTDYNFHTAGVAVREDAARVEVEIRSPEAPGCAVLDRTTPPELPPYSAFGKLEEAAERLKYQPRGLSVGKDGRVSVVEILRDEAAWRSRLVRVERARWAFLEGRPVLPEICYEVEPIAYRWNPGQGRWRET